jgi:hypothetical protein
MLSRRAAATGSNGSAWRGGAVRSWKMRGELTMCAFVGSASGTWMTSMRKSAEFGSSSGFAPEHPGSSFGDRTGAEPET